MHIIRNQTYKHTKQLFQVALLFLLLAVGIIGYKNFHNSNSYDTKEVEILDFSGGSLVKFKTQVADTDVKRELGLSYRKSINFTTHPLGYEGMLFIFPNETTSGFWMKDMNFNLDIIFIDSDKKIVKVFKELIPCPKDLNQCPAYAPGGKYLYVLEVDGGLSDKLGIKEGQEVVIK